MKVREALVPILLSIVIAVAVIGVGIATRNNNMNQLEITCQSAQANIDQLSALRQISRSLGLPIRFVVPELPEECS